MSDYKSTLKHILLCVADKSKTYEEFYKTIISDYKISAADIAEFGYQYIVEITSGCYKGVVLCEDQEKGCEVLKKSYNTFLYGYDHTDAFISEDKCYASIDTTDYDWRFRANVYKIGDSYD